MTIAPLNRDRLTNLIDFVAESTKLNARPPICDVEQHGGNLQPLYEHEIQGLPGINLNQLGDDVEDEVWLTVQRLSETSPPSTDSPVLIPWLAASRNPSTEPTLRTSVIGQALIDAGTHVPGEDAFEEFVGEDEDDYDPVEEEDGLPRVPAARTVPLDSYEAAPTVRAAFDRYLNESWRPWAEEERRRRRTIALYARLFTLKQALEGGVVESQIEMVWGVGQARWRYAHASVNYPLVSRVVSLALNPETASIEIRPRDAEPRLELDWFASANNPGVVNVEKAGREFFAAAAVTFSPFDRGTFEPVLLSAVANLDPNGVYWPNEANSDDRTLPPTTEHLTVSDTWVLFVRPRVNSSFLDDLARLKEATEEADALPPLLDALSSDPATENQPVELPEYRGVSILSQAYVSEETGISSSSKTPSKPQDLYFPKPFNDEQVRIVQLLDVSDGVVVQGPPGTGKTHTIANVICHYLASGRRVLVTSMKDPALAVLHQQLPPEIQPLVISLLTSEREGMKQFEFAIQKIASEVARLDQTQVTKDIQALERTIDSLHAKLATVDTTISSWAKKNLTKITLGDECIDPQAAAFEVTDHADDLGLISDPLSIEAEFAPQFDREDISNLRSARRELGADIRYLYASLPQVVEFPESRELLEVHRDLSHFDRLQQTVMDGHVPALADSSSKTIAKATDLQERLASLREERASLDERGWHPGEQLKERVKRRKSDDHLLNLFEKLGTELITASERRSAFLERPVSGIDAFDGDPKIASALTNLANGQPAFGFLAFGVTEQKKIVDSIRVVGERPTTRDGWAHVFRYVAWRQSLRALAIRWNGLAADLGLERVAEQDPQGGLDAAEQYAVYLRLTALVKAERALATATKALFPGWGHGALVSDDEAYLDELDAALRHHLTKERLAAVWSVKERFLKVLEGRVGRVIDEIRSFMNNTLGNPQVSDADMQGAWAALMTELTRVLGLAHHLQTVRDVTARIRASGAPAFADALQEPVDGVADRLLPDSLFSVWRWKRLATHLDGIDPRSELRALGEQRKQLERQLARAYQEVVVKRTWLKLAQNASPSVRAALQAYLNAIKLIGKGTGVRAVRFRQNARVAAREANPAVPCWIMPHYRISESLPATLGCFDLVIIDEASQSDLSALPAILRAKKILIVGDDKQVSPEGVGMAEEKIKTLMGRFLGSQVRTYRDQMDPSRSIYDLFKVVFAHAFVMLREHFRCVPPIIEFSKREWYNHELVPLRIPHASERLDPPLIDVMVKDGYRSADINRPEAQFIINEITRIVADPGMAGRSVGVISLIGSEQARHIWDRLAIELGPDIIDRHAIACGDARMFQGKERDIMFLSMVSAPNYVGAPLTRAAFEQRFNVAASRARDRMYLVRSVSVDDLSEADTLRRKLLAHFTAPFTQDETKVADLRQLCESPFEEQVYDELTQRGYRVTPQVPVGSRRIDLVVEGGNDARLAVECDGETFHGPERWAEDAQRQRQLERLGWTFWRSFYSPFIRRRSDVMADLIETLQQHGIEPVGADGAARSIHTESRIVSADDVFAVDNELTEVDRRPQDNTRELGFDQLRTDRSGEGDAIETAERPSSQSPEPPAAPQLAPLDQPVPTPHREEPPPQLPLGFLGEPARSNAELDLAEFFRDRNLEIVDWRPRGGKLWVIGGVELKPMMQELRSRTDTTFGFAPSGGHATMENGKKRAGWYGPK